MIPNWSSKAKKAKSEFYTEWNDIDIYIEDTGIASKKIIRQLISRCFSEKYRVAEVFPLGGKTAVITACEKDQVAHGRPRLYIIDGDLDLILNTPIPPLNRLFSLPVYCIENLLIDEAAVVEVLYEDHPTKEKNEIIDELKFDEWLNTINSSLVNLFIDYALCKSIIPTKETVKYKISKLVSSGDGRIDESKIGARCDDIESEIISCIGFDNFKSRKANITGEITSRGINNCQIIVSGKDYLMPLLRLRMRLITKQQVDNACLNIRLAKYCDITKIMSICNLFSNNEQYQHEEAESLICS